MVLHPDLENHLQKCSSYLLTGIKSGLDADQISLLLSDFSIALDHWDIKACCNRVESFKALEASRYAEINPAYGKVDVNIAVKLLVPLESEEDWRNQKRFNVGIQSFADDSLLRCRFSLLKPEGEQVNDASAAEEETKKPRGVEVKQLNPPAKVAPIKPKETPRMHCHHEGSSEGEEGYRLNRTPPPPGKSQQKNRQLQHPKLPRTVLLFSKKFGPVNSGSQL